MATQNEKNIELESKIKLVDQKIDLMMNNHLAHIQKDIDRILIGVGTLAILVLGQLLYILSN